MAEETPTQLDTDERDAFLGRGGTGVISFATDEETPPHSVPIAYGYDADNSTFYFRLAVGKEHTKAALLDRPVTFVVYGEEGDRWESVVAAGTLEATDTDGIETETLDGLDRVHIPLVEIFDAPVRTVTFEFVRLVPENITGRKESPGSV